MSERIASKASGVVAPAPKKSLAVVKKPAAVDGKENTDHLNQTRPEEEAKMEVDNGTDSDENDDEEPKPANKSRATHKPTKHVEGIDTSKLVGKRAPPPTEAPKRSSSRSAGAKREEAGAKKQKKIK